MIDIEQKKVLYYSLLRHPSSRGLGHCPFTAATGVRIPLGVPTLEVWLSGLKQRFTKPSTGKLVRGFESYHFRQ